MFFPGEPGPHPALFLYGEWPLEGQAGMLVSSVPTLTLTVLLCHRIQVALVPRQWPWNQFYIFS